MSEIKSFEDLKQKQEEIKKTIKDRSDSEDPENTVHVKIAMATCGIAAGARPIMEYFIEQLDRRNINGIVTQTGCMGYCYAEPTIEVTLPGKEPVIYGDVNEKKADEIIEKYIKTGEMVDGIIPVNYETIENN